MILDATPKLIEIIYHDSTRSARHDTGREGMNAEQVLRCCVLKQYRQLTYEELAFHLEDSTARRFSRLQMGQYPSKSILHENIKHITDHALYEAIHRALLDYARDEKIDTGRKIRIDSTAIETDIHHPTDSTLLVDGDTGHYPLAERQERSFRLFPCTLSATTPVFP